MMWGIGRNMMELQVRARRIYKHYGFDVAMSVHTRRPVVGNPPTDKPHLKNPPSKGVPHVLPPPAPAPHAPPAPHAHAEHGRPFVKAAPAQTPAPHTHAAPKDASHVAPSRPLQTTAKGAPLQVPQQTAHARASQPGATQAASLKPIQPPAKHASFLTEHVSSTIKTPAPTPQSAHGHTAATQQPAHPLSTPSAIVNPAIGGVHPQHTQAPPYAHRQPAANQDSAHIVPATTLPRRSAISKSPLAGVQTERLKAPPPSASSLRPADVHPRSAQPYRQPGSTAQPVSMPPIVAVPIPSSSTVDPDETTRAAQAALDRFQQVTKPTPQHENLVGRLSAAMEQEKARIEKVQAEKHALEEQVKSDKSEIAVLHLNSEARRDKTIVELTNTLNAVNAKAVADAKAAEADNKAVEAELVAVESLLRT